MSFKLNNPPYKDDKIKVYKVPMEEGVLGKANNAVSSNSGFTIHVNQNINDTDTLNKVVNHEKEHTDQMARGDLAYNDDVVVWKGKEYPRDEMEEGNHDLAWEKEIYDEQPNTSPMAFKLRKGSGNMPQFHNLSGRGLIKPGPLNKLDYNHDGTTESNEETEEEKRARLAREAKEKAQQDMQVVNTTETILEDGSTQIVEDLEGEGEATDFSNDPEERARQVEWIKNNPEKYKEMLEAKKLKDQRITIKPPKTKEPDYSYLDGATFGEGHQAGDFSTHGLQLMSTVGDDDPRAHSQQRKGEDPMSRYLTQPELDYLKKKHSWKGNYYAGYDTYYKGSKPEGKKFQSGVERGLIDETGKTIPLNPVKEKLDESKNLLSETGL